MNFQKEGIHIYGFTLKRDNSEGTFPKAFSPMATSQATISQVASSQMYIFPNDNFPSSNFIMKEVLNEHISFTFLKN